MEHYHFEYPSIPQSESRMLDDISELLKKNQISPDLLHKIMLVVSEAYTNAYLHGNQKNTEMSIKIDLDIKENLITVDITDEGKAKEGLNKIKNKKPATPLRENGRGIDLMKHFADEICFEGEAGGGLKVTTKFYRTEKSKVKI